MTEVIYTTVIESRLWIVESMWSRVRTFYRSHTFDSDATQDARPRPRRCSQVNRLVVTSRAPCKNALSPYFVARQWRHHRMSETRIETRCMAPMADTSQVQTITAAIPLSTRFYLWHGRQVYENTPDARPRKNLFLNIRFTSEEFRPCIVRRRRLQLTMCDIPCKSPWDI